VELLYLWLILNLILMTDPIKKIGFRNGLILGSFLILFSTYLHFYNLELLTNVWLGFSTVFILVAFGIYSILQTKTKLGGLLSFKEAFSSYFYTILVGNVMNTVYLLFLYLVILSPETKEIIRQLMIDLNVRLMQQGNAPQATIDEAMPLYQSFNPFTVSEVLTSALKYLLRDCFIGLLVALIFRNKQTL
jgi:hypothetical protein